MSNPGGIVWCEFFPFVRSLANRYYEYHHLADTYALRQIPCLGLWCVINNLHFEVRECVSEIVLMKPLVWQVLATRDPAAYGEDLASWVQYGASPRASIALDRCARAKAWLNGKDFVGP
jgi:hypothetical protein